MIKNIKNLENHCKDIHLQVFKQKYYPFILLTFMVQKLDKNNPIPANDQK